MDFCGFFTFFLFRGGDCFVPTAALKAQVFFFTYSEFKECVLSSRIVFIMCKIHPP